MRGSGARVRTREAPRLLLLLLLGLLLRLLRLLGRVALAGRQLLRLWLWGTKHAPKTR